MKKAYLVLIIAAVVLAGGLMFLRSGKGISGLTAREDSWIKDSRGVYVKHGNPSETPAEVAEQLEAIECAGNLYYDWSESGKELRSQCLGKCFDVYAVDFVSVPRSEEDDLAENQCELYRSGFLKKFIEVDSSGKIVRIE